MKSINYLSIVCFSLSPLAMGQEAVELKEEKVTAIAKKANQQEQAKVQIAILLDSSTSMNGLITQAQAQLWDVVNAFIDAKVEGHVPFVEVALYTHGQGDLGENKDYIRLIEPLTRDLDKLSQELFALRTTGSQEYCGTVISRASKQLKWDDNPETYKAIFIAGNESFFQGSTDAKAACSEAIGKGIIVNSIYCGDEKQGIEGGWATGAKLAEGSFSFINQHQEMVAIEAPQDAKIMELNSKLNETYVTYNEIGKERVEMQVSSDAQNTNLSKEAGVKRAMCKSSANYHNASWDLVDAVKAKDFDWTTVKEENLPSELKQKNTEERKAWIAEKQNERQQIQKKIAELSSRREAFVAEKRLELAEKNGEALDTVMKKIVVEQAKEKGYSFKK